LQLLRYGAKPVLFEIIWNVDPYSCLIWGDEMYFVLLKASNIFSGPVQGKFPQMSTSTQSGFGGLIYAIALS